MKTTTDLRLKVVARFTDLEPDERPRTTGHGGETIEWQRLSADAYIEDDGTLTRVQVTAHGYRVKVDGTVGLQARNTCYRSVDFLPPEWQWRIREALRQEADRVTVEPL